MRYEFDHRTGGMVPKKDDSIYFAQSQGGGLIVDDKKNNVRYIIEREGKITKLFGSFRGDNLNFYDMRDARMIADRVVRLLGRDHKYSDFHYFLKGYHMDESVVMTCSDYIGESVWNDMRQKSLGIEIKKEVGRVIGTLEDGTKLIIDADIPGELYDFDGDKWCDFEDAAIIAVVEKGNGEDVYYRYDDTVEDGVNMIECFTADSSLQDNNFGALRALVIEDNWDERDFDNVIVKFDGSHFEIRSRYTNYMIFDGEDAARRYAFDDMKGLLESDVIRKEDVARYRRTCGDGIFDTDEMEKEFRESYESYYDDLSEDDAIRELLNRNIIEKTEEYFDVDEDGDLDIDLPKFDYMSYSSDFVDNVIDGIRDIVDEFISNYGIEGIEQYIDMDKLTDGILDIDGLGFLASEDGKERTAEIDGHTYYLFKIS